MNLHLFLIWPEPIHHLYFHSNCVERKEQIRRKQIIHGVLFVLELACIGICFDRTQLERELIVC